MKNIDLKFLIFLLLITQGNPLLKPIALLFIQPEALQIPKINSKPIYFYALMILISLAHGFFYINNENYYIALFASTAFWSFCLVALIMTLNFIRKSPEKTARTLEVYAQIILACSIAQYLALCITTNSINPFTASQAAGDNITGIFSSANNNMIACVLLSIYLYYQKKKYLAFALGATAVATSFLGGLIIAAASIAIAVLSTDRNVKRKIAILASIGGLVTLLILFSNKNIQYAMYYIERTITMEDPPLKIVSLMQTLQFWIESPKHFFFGAGPANFSSRIAFVVSGDYVTWFPSHLIYISNDFLNNHFHLWTSDLSIWDNRSSAANQPMSIYNQIIGEYGALGIIVFLFFYFLPFAKKSTPCTRILMLFMGGIFLFDYWFEHLDVIIIFEVLALHEIYSMRQNNQSFIRNSSMANT